MRIPSQLSARGIDRVVAWSIPLTTRFRGITERDGLLLHGPAGWAEFSPFWDYDAEQSLPWLQAAIADACQERPSPWRTDIPVNATIPVVAPALAGIGDRGLPGTAVPVAHGHPRQRHHPCCRPCPGRAPGSGGRGLPGQGQGGRSRSEERRGGTG